MLLDKLMANADGIEALAKARAGLRDERWGREYAEAIGQSAVYGSDWPMDQLAAFACTHAMINGGSAAFVGVQTLGAPRQDSEREANAAALASLPHPFIASVWMHQHNADNDGMVTWSEPIKVQAATGRIEQRENGSTAPIPVQFEIPPGRVPLEIGFTKPSATWAHIAGEGGVARWPYGHSRLHIFVNLCPI